MTPAQEIAREIAGECMERPRMALDHGQIVDDCLTRLKTESLCPCEPCSLTEQIAEAWEAAHTRGYQEAIERCAAHLDTVASEETFGDVPLPFKAYAALAFKQEARSLRTLGGEHV